ncbi:hypothetical protein [Kurthia sibirica]|uniref:Uncharacterized protein n=1 Tax=Kurthia sibirica TaxID=202750 RepID=A0A2U3AGY6_9BACL|nr:hypothetical protein [Kurthia sibirica]PWI23721.1 hypothetical protein DEX24_15620 [Kurthia sibirica]GEK35514.1 hypothetical protein KSI01_30470 [Kurthia sibirica]
MNIHQSDAKKIEEIATFTKQVLEKIASLKSLENRNLLDPFVTYTFYKRIYESMQYANFGRFTVASEYVLHHFELLCQEQMIEGKQVKQVTFPESYYRESVLETYYLLNEGVTGMHVVQTILDAPFDGSIQRPISNIYRTFERIEVGFVAIIKGDLKLADFYLTDTKEILNELTLV